MKVISGSVNSWLVSLIISIASASGSRPSVADRCGWPWPPTPGVSMNASPLLSRGLLRGDLDPQHLAAAGLRVRGADRS